MKQVFMNLLSNAVKYTQQRTTAVIEVEILYIEDNAADAELALVALRRTRLANPIRIVRDGAEALDFLFCRGAHANREFLATISLFTMPTLATIFILLLPVCR